MHPDWMRELDKHAKCIGGVQAAGEEESGLRSGCRDCLECAGDLQLLRSLQSATGTLRYMIENRGTWLSRHNARSNGLVNCRRRRLAHGRATHGHLCHRGRSPPVWSSSHQRQQKRCTAHAGGVFADGSAGDSARCAESGGYQEHASAAGRTGSGADGCAGRSV